MQSQKGKKGRHFGVIKNGRDINAFNGLELMTAIKKNNKIIAKKINTWRDGVLIEERWKMIHTLVTVRFVFQLLSCRGTYEKLQGFDTVAYSNERK